MTDWIRGNEFPILGVVKDLFTCRRDLTELAT